MMMNDAVAVLLWLLAEWLEDEFLFWGIDHRRRSHVHRFMCWQETFWWQIWQRVMDAAIAVAKTTNLKERILSYWICTVGG